MSRILDEANRILSALQEGQVMSVITLHEHGHLNAPIREVLTSPVYGLNMPSEDVDYWIDWFKIKEN